MFPVSVKGVVVRDGRVLLLRNDRDEWDVFVVTYGCHATDAGAPVLSHEHTAVGLFTEAEVAGPNLPAGYRRSVGSWFGRLRAAG